VRRGQGRRNVPALRNAGRGRDGAQDTDPITMPDRRAPREPAQTKLF
jgi:hypothetical protein